MNLYNFDIFPPKLDDIHVCNLFLKADDFHVFLYIFLLHVFFSTGIYISLKLDNLSFHQYG